MSVDGEEHDGWRGNYDGWLTTDRRDVPSAEPVSRPDYRPVDAAERAYLAARGEVHQPALAYLVARRSLRMARDSRDLAVRADWIRAAKGWRDLARMLRSRS